MNKVHAAVIAHLRRVAVERDTGLQHQFEPLTDEQIVRLMFSSVRGYGENAKGLRLNEGGLQIMMDHFQYFEIKYPNEYRVQTLGLVYLDRRAKLPYYYSSKSLVLFETELGMMLKLIDGDFSQACAIDGA